MKWFDTQFEKVKAIGSVAFTVFLDALLMIIIFIIFQWLQIILEDMIFHKDLQTIITEDNNIKTIYSISKYFVISILILYFIADIIVSIMDIIEKIINKFKKK